MDSIFGSIAIVALVYLTVRKLDRARLMRKRELLQKDLNTLPQWDSCEREKVISELRKVEFQLESY